MPSCPTTKKYPFWLDKLTVSNKKPKREKSHLRSRTINRETRMSSNKLSSCRSASFVITSCQENKWARRKRLATFNNKVTM